MFTEITMKKFVDLAGELGGECVRRRKTGTTWMLADGRVVFELKDPKGWRYILADPSKVSS